MFFTSLSSESGRLSPVVVQVIPQAIFVRGDVFGVISGQHCIFDLLDMDFRLITAQVRKLELHIFASAGAELRRRRVGDRLGLDV